MCVCIHIFIYIFSLPFKLRERSERFFFLKLSTKNGLHNLWGKQSGFGTKKYFSTWNLPTLFHQEETVLKLGWFVAVPHLCWPLHASAPLYLCDSLTGGAPDES